MYVSNADINVPFCAMMQKTDEYLTWIEMNVSKDRREEIEHVRGIAMFETARDYMDKIEME